MQIEPNKIIVVHYHFLIKYELDIIIFDYIELNEIPLI